MSCKNCTCTQSSVSQTLDELDFERGIWHAALYNERDRVEQLLMKGVCVNALDNGGYTALHYAARAGHVNICRLLISSGADVNAATRATLSTALHRAAMMGKEEVTNLLLEKGANPNQLDCDGKNALHKSVENGKVALSQNLAARFPNLLDICDIHGKTPADYDKAAIFSSSPLL